MFLGENSKPRLRLAVTRNRKTFFNCRQSSSMSRAPHASLALSGYSRFVWTANTNKNAKTSNPQTHARQPRGIVFE